MNDAHDAGTLTIQPWSDGLSENIATFPDYLIHRLARAGPGRIEAEWPGLRDQDEIVWRYTSRRTGDELEITTSPQRIFRTLLARWAAFAKIDPYGGHTLFRIDQHPEWPLSGVHRFAFYLCNEPTMAFWFKLYLYSGAQYGSTSRDHSISV